MKLTKERARKPLIDDGYSFASTGYENRETTFTLTCHTPWIQGKGHELSYTLHLTKLEMLQAVSEWMQKLRQNEIAEQKRATAIAEQERAGK